MTNVVTVGSFRKLDNEDIKFYDDLYAIDNERNTISFTPLGVAYYGSWFRRMGFPFDGIDADTFIVTVRDIGRLLFDEDAANAAMQPEDQAVWNLLAEGRNDEFTEAFLALAETRREQSGSRVVSLRTAKTQT